jgi:hypothetical protein
MCNRPDCICYEPGIDQPAPEDEVRVDALVRRKMEEHDFCMICPDCGHHPLTLMGERKGLTLKLTGGKAQCPVCPYEMEL